MVTADRYFTLADPAIRARALSDITAWLEGLPFASVIDEAQLAPGLTVAAKTLVDERNGKPGQFLLTGSSRISRSELGGSDALVGRARWLRVEPLAQCEIAGGPRDVVTALFDQDPREWRVDPVTHRDFLARFSRGGMPMLRDLDPEVRAIDVDQYASGLFNGDVYKTGRNRQAILRLFKHLSAVSSDLENFDKLGRALVAAKPTIQNHLDALNQVFLMEAQPGYRPDPSKRIMATRRLHVADPAFVAAIRGIDQTTQMIGPELGGFVETAVFAELRRLIGWSRLAGLQLHHWRKDNKREVDVVIERADGKVLAIEVKSARRVGQSAGHGISAFRLENPDTFHRGFVIHSGDHIERLEENVWAVPFSVLWTVGDLVGPATGDTERSLVDRLNDAKATVWAQRSQRLDEAVEHTLRLSRTIERAETRFAEVETLLAIFLPALQDLGVATELSDVRPPEPTSSVAWNASQQLVLKGSAGNVVLNVQARVDLDDLDVIRWHVGDSQGESYGGPFSTHGTESALPQLEERLGRFADAVPDLVAHLSGASG